MLEYHRITQVQYDYINMNQIIGLPESIFQYVYYPADLCELTLSPSLLYVFIERFPAYPPAWQYQDLREGIRRHASEKDYYIG